MNAASAKWIKSGGDSSPKGRSPKIEEQIKSEEQIKRCVSLASRQLVPRHLFHGLAVSVLAVPATVGSTSRSAHVTYPMPTIML